MRNWIQIIKLQGYRYLFFAFIAVGVAIVCQSCLFIITEKDVERALGESRSANITNNDMEMNCILTLRALASTELAYQGHNRNRNYGTWRSLVENNYIQRGITRESIIDYYSICVFSINKSWNVSGVSMGNSSFTIIAVPRRKDFDLRTFGIDQRQTPRVWIGRNISLRELAWMSVNSDLLWQPMR